MIYFRCVHCQQKLQARDELRGRNIRCPKCRQVCAVPKTLLATLANPGRSVTAQPPGQVASSCLEYLPRRFVRQLSGGNPGSGNGADAKRGSDGAGTFRQRRDAVTGTGNVYLADLRPYQGAGIPNPRRTGPRRDGRGLQSPAAELASPGRPENDPGRRPRRDRRFDPLPGGGGGHCPVATCQHRACLRSRRIRGQAILFAGVLRRRQFEGEAQRHAAACPGSGGAGRNAGAGHTGGARRITSFTAISNRRTSC